MSGNTTDLSAIHALVTGVKQPDKPNVSSPTLTFDIEKYMEMFDGKDLTEDEQTAILTVLWEIMSRFVELGLGIDAGSIACGEQSDSHRLSDEDLLHLTNNQKTTD